MTTLRAHQRFAITALTLMLTLAGTPGCNREPYWLGPDDVVGDSFPDQDIDLEAERANPGHEMHVPSEEEQANFRDCTKEELAVIKASDGRVTSKTLGCVKFDYFAEPPLPGETRQDE